KSGTNVVVHDSGAWTDYCPTLTAGNGQPFTSARAAGRYKKTGRDVDVVVTVTITTNGLAGSSVIATVPAIGRSMTPFSALRFDEGTAQLTALACAVAAGDIHVSMVRADGTYPGADNVQLVFSGRYESTT